MKWLSRLLARTPQPEPLTADLLRRIRLSFEEAAADEGHFPSHIDPRIHHVRFLLNFLGDLAGKRVLDIGCGKGRFARIVKEGNSSATVVAVDLSEAMLRCVPPGIPPVAASMTALPFADGTFDAAYATESLEHAVDIPGAVAEMTRVLKRGGRLVIIERNMRQWGRLEELDGLLRRHCRRVSSTPISYWEDVKPDGLFQAWSAEK